MAMNALTPFCPLCKGNHWLVQPHNGEDWSRPEPTNDIEALKFMLRNLKRGIWLLPSEGGLFRDDD